MASWLSPDGRIQKDVLREGRFGYKPSEGSHCTISVTDTHVSLEPLVVIGDNDGDLGRLLDICLMTMFVGEKSKFTLDLGDSSVTLVVELIDLIFNGFIYDWDTRKKYTIALGHKDKGNTFFQQKNNKEAAHRFVKALKILSSVPVDVENTSEQIDDVRLEDINKLKGNLYNNLASCYFRNNRWEMVIDLCKKVFIFDSDNVKALYKIAVSYENDRNFEKAHKTFARVLELDPNNTSSAEHLNFVRSELKKAEIKCNNMMKKMFTAALQN